MNLKQTVNDKLKSVKARHGLMMEIYRKLFDEFAELAEGSKELKSSTTMYSFQLRWLGDAYCDYTVILEAQIDNFGAITITSHEGGKRNLKVFHFPSEEQLIMAYAADIVTRRLVVLGVYQTDEGESC